MELDYIVQMLNHVDKPIFLVVFYVGFQGWRTFKAYMNEFVNNSRDMKDEFVFLRKEVTQLKDEFIKHSSTTTAEMKDLKERVRRIEDKNL